MHRPFVTCMLAGCRVAGAESAPPGLAAEKNCPLPCNSLSAHREWPHQAVR